MGFQYNPNLPELKIRQCNESLPYMCYKTADILFFQPGLSICPSGYLGSEDVGYCFRFKDDSPRQVSRQDAIQYCKQNGGKLLQLNLNEDQKLAIRLFAQLGLINTSVWFENKDSPVSCSALRLSDSMTISSSTDCDMAAHVVCQSDRSIPAYSSSDLQIEYQQPKYISRREILSGNLSCFFPHPHLETDSYSVYKGGAILTRLSNFQTNYSSEIMRWNGEDDTEQSFLASVSTNLNLYRCEIQRKGVGKLLTKTVYAVPNEKRVAAFHARVRVRGRLSLSEALSMMYFEYLNNLDSFQIFQSNLISLITSVNSDLRSVTNGTLRYIRLTNIELRQLDTVHFLLSFVGPDDEWKSANAMKDLLTRITVSARSTVPRTRRKRQQGLLSIVISSFEVRSEEYCTLGYSPDFQTTFSFLPVGNRSETYSDEICITDSQPLLMGVCHTQIAAPAEVRDVTVNPNCLFLLSPSFSNMTSLKKLSQVSTNGRNVQHVAADVANLTSSAGNLTVQDVVYTSVVLQNIARIPNVTELTTDYVLQTLSNVLEASEQVLTTAHNIGSSTTRILESVEKVTKNVVLKDKKYVNFKKAFALSVTDITPGDTPIIGIQLKSIDVDVVLNNESISLISADENINVSSINTGIILPPVSLQGNNTRVILTIYENTNIFQVRPQNRHYMLNGKVASATLISNGKSVKDLAGKYVQSVYKPLNDSVDSVCGFWNHSLYATSGGWSTKGCIKTEVKDGLVVCECNHLTNFAILLDVKSQTDVLDAGNQLALSVITIIGLSLSIIGLGLTVVSFILIRQLRKGRGQQTLFNLALALLCSMVIFLAGMDRTESYYGCIAVAALMHYFLLVSFMWMLVEGFLQYLRFVRVLGTYVPRFMLKVSIPAWGLPLLPVIIVLAVDYDLYKGGNYYCWMSPTPFYYAFLIPMALIIIVNCIVFALVLKSLLNRPKGLQSNQSEAKQAMMNLKAALSIFILLGLTWIFGILAIEDARVIFSYIFTILTTFQGFFIFILFVAREKQFRSYWRKLCCQRFSDKQKKYKPTSATHSSSQALTKLGLSNVQTASTDDLHSSN
ncbi:adhesion G-protein coupled receptor G7-like isoform X2 [Crassostrea virginica]